MSGVSSLPEQISMDSGIRYVAMIWQIASFSIPIKKEEEEESETIHIPLEHVTVSIYRFAPVLC